MEACGVVVRCCRLWQPHITPLVPFHLVFASWNLFWTSPPELSRQASKWVELVFFSWAVSVTTGLSISTAIYYPLSVLAEGVRHWRLWVRLVSELCDSLVVLYGGLAFPRSVSVSNLIVQVL